ncbi:MAG: hypothetical protein Q9184_005859 [Pyrenodesmia sp. 2 TL-2023]
MSSDQKHARISGNPLMEGRPYSAPNLTTQEQVNTPADLTPGSLNTLKPTKEHSSSCFEPITTNHTHTSRDPSTEQDPRIPTHDQRHSPHHLTTTHPSKASSPVHQNPGAAKDSPPSTISAQLASCADPQDWVDPLSLSPLTPSSQASSPSWVDPLQDWDGTLSESPDGWVDPLIAHSLPSHPSSALSSSGQPSPDPQVDSSPNGNPRKKRKRTSSTFSTSSTDQPGSGTPSVVSSSMPGSGHKGKNVSTQLSHRRGLISGHEACTLKVPKPPKDAPWIKARLEAHGLVQNDRDAYKRYPQFAASVGRIINQKRQSKVDIKEFENFQFALEAYKTQNEDTVLAALLPFIIKPDRTVQVSPAGPAVQGHSYIQDQTAPLTKDEVWEVSSFLRDGLVTIVNREFARTFLAFRDDGSVLDKDVVKALQKEDGMTNPKPDRTYAIMRTKYKFPQHFRLPAKISLYLEIVKDVHHPFFIFEGKSNEGSPLDAANQACRAGAAVVRTARLLRAELGETDVQGADDRTFVFSATMSPGLIELWVHWAEVLPEEEGGMVVYHMTKLSSKALDDEQHFGQVRRMLHNILDWGCGARFDNLKPLYEAIVAHEQRPPAESAAKVPEQSTEESDKRQKTGP